MNKKIADRDPALLVVDVQQGLFERSTRVHNAGQMLANINKLIRRARELEIPVIFVQHQNENTLVRDSITWQLHPQIQPLEDELIIYKQHGDAFKDTQLQEELTRQQVSVLWVTGLVSQGCVRATSLGGIQRGYHVILVTDGHSTFSKGASGIIDKMNRALERAGAELVTTEDLLRRI